MPAHHVIERVEIEGATNFPELKMELVDDHNDVVGQTGTSKTSLLDIIRYGVGARLPPGREAAARYLAQIEATLGPGQVTVVTRTPFGERYRWSRRLGEEPHAVNMTTGTELSGASLGADIFESEHYGPGEILALAHDPVGQLVLIDQFARDEVARASEDIARIERRLADGDAELRRLARELEEDAKITQDLPVTEDLLAGLQRADGPEAADITRGHEAKAVRGRERTAMAGLSKELATVRASFDALAKDACARIGGAVSADLERGLHAAIFQRAHAAAQRASSAVEDSARRLHDELAAAENGTTAEAGALAALHGQEDGAYQALLARHEEDHARTAKRASLQARCEELRHAKKLEAERRREHDAQRAERDALLQERTRLYLRLWEVRQDAVAVLKERVGGYVQVDVAHGKGTAQYEALLVDILHGSGVYADSIHWIATGVRPADLVDAVRRDDPQRLVEVDEMKKDKVKRARNIMKCLRESGRLSELETVFLGDVPTIRLKVGDDFEESSKLSTGQACTCILAIVLARRGIVLVMDQPDDHLDNRYVFKVFVQALRAVKEHCQLIIVTHNANLPMLGDAGRVFLLAAAKRIARLEKLGTADEMNAVLEDLMEGGPIAFLGRGARYGHKLVAREDGGENDDGGKGKR